MSKRRDEGQGLPSVGVISLGCPKSLVDAERLAGHLASAGFPAALDAEAADVLVVNTCAFVADAVAESLDQIERCLAFRDAGRVSKVLVTGCLPLRGTCGDVLGRADAVFGSGEHEAVESYLRSGVRPPGPPRLVRHAVEGCRLRLTPGHFAYLRVSEGCGNRCSYCTIPSIRGGLASKRMADLAAEAEELAGSGASDIALVGQDVASWGSDLGGPGLPALLGALSAVKGIRRITMMYLHPAHLGDDAIGAAASGGPVSPYFDVPMQHADDGVLAAMNRGTDSEMLRGLIGRIRTKIPRAALRTTFMVGFPGESEAAFGRLLEFARWARFDRTGAFAYSREPGTPAHGMQGQVPEEEKRRRLAELRRIAAETARLRNEEMIGREIEVVVDGPAPEPGVFECRSYREAFDVDPVVLVRKRNLSAGLWGMVKVSGIRGSDLWGIWKRNA